MEQSAQHHPLWDAFKEGNKSAFSAIYQKYGGALTNYGLRILPDTAHSGSIRRLVEQASTPKPHLFGEAVSFQGFASSYIKE
jgi:hypothetical protein